VEKGIMRAHGWRAVTEHAHEQPIQPVPAVVVERRVAVRTLRRRHVQKEHDAVAAFAIELLKAANGPDPGLVAVLPHGGVDQCRGRPRLARTGVAQLLVRDIVEVRQLLLLRIGEDACLPERLLFAVDVFEALPVRIGRRHLPREQGVHLLIELN